MPLPKAPDPVMVIAQEEPGTATYLRNAVKAEIFELQKKYSFTGTEKYSFTGSEEKGEKKLVFEILVFLNPSF